MEKNRRNKQFKSLPRHVSPKIAFLAASKKPKLSESPPTGEAVDKHEMAAPSFSHFATYPDAFDSECGDIGDLKNLIHVEFIHASVEDSVGASEDHHYCKKDECESKLSSPDAPVKIVPADENILERTDKENFSDLRRDFTQPIKRKRGRPSKNSASKVSPPIFEDPSLKENETCCICDQKFVLSAIRSYRRFGLHTYVSQLGVSPIQMLNRLMENPQDNFPETDDENANTNLKQFLCYHCFSNLRGAYTSLVSLKDKMNSFLGRIHSQSVFKDRLCINKPTDDNNPSEDFNDVSAFRLCNNLDVEHIKLSSNRANQTDSDDYNENRPAKQRKSNIRTPYQLLNSLSCDDADKSLMKCLFTKNFSSFFRLVLKHPELKKVYTNFLKAQIIKEVNDEVNNKSSILLQNFSEHSVNNFGWKQLQDELETVLPTLTTVLKSAIFNKSLMNAIENDDTLNERTEEEFLRKTISLCSVMANILYQNNRRMCLLQEANSVMMFHAGSTNWMIHTLHHLGYCVPSKSLKPYVDLRRKIKDVRMAKWRKKILKPRVGMKVLAFGSGGILAKDLDVDDGSTYSKDDAPRGCKVVYIQGSKTSISVKNYVQPFYDSDESHEDELQLPKLLEEKYERECASEEISSEVGCSANDTITNCQKALDNALHDLCGNKDVTASLKDGNLFSSVQACQLASFETKTCDAEQLKSLLNKGHSNTDTEPTIVRIISNDELGESEGKCVEIIADDGLENFNDPSTDPSKILIQNFENFPESTETGEVMYLVMDNEEVTGNILLDLKEARFAST